MTDRRQVRVVESFFNRLDLLLPSERTADGVASAADFLLYELPPIIDRIATRFEDVTLPVNEPGVRVLITSGILFRRITVYAELVGDGVELFWLDVDEPPKW